MLDDKPLVSIEKLRVEFETNDGVVVGVKLDPQVPCPAPADSEVQLRNGVVVCLAP